MKLRLKVTREMSSRTFIFIKVYLTREFGKVRVKTRSWPVPGLPGVQIVERKKKYSERKRGKNVGRLFPSSARFFPHCRLLRSLYFSFALCYLNAWNMLRS